MPYYVVNKDSYNEYELNSIREVGDRLHEVFVHVADNKPNVERTRSTLARVLGSHMLDHKMKKTLSEFSVVCDDSNNPQKVIQNKDIHAGVNFKFIGQARLDPVEIKLFAQFV